MICPSCKADNDSSAESCFTCGKSLGTLTMGSVVGNRYEILDYVGKGGMGMIYKAHDRVLDEIVALKTLRPQIATDADMVKRFVAEIKLARKIRHRNVCAIHDYGQDGSLLYISMEFIEGIDLKKILTEKGPFPPQEAFEIAVQVAKGLEAIHEAGVIHRDLKTQNLIRDSKAQVKLLDFGIAKQQDSESGMTGTGQLVGTPEYMSPEQVRGKAIDHRSDLYALGIVVFEAFTGQVPFHGDTPIITLFKHLEEPPPLTGPKARLLPAAVVPVIAKMLAKAPADRYASAGDIIEALRQARLEAFPQLLATPAPFPAPAFPDTPSGVVSRPAMPTPLPSALGGTPLPSKAPGVAVPAPTPPPVQARPGTPVPARPATPPPIRPTPPPAVAPPPLPAPLPAAKPAMPTPIPAAAAAPPAPPPRPPTAPILAPPTPDLEATVRQGRATLPPGARSAEAARESVPAPRPSTPTPVPSPTLVPEPAEKGPEATVVTPVVPSPAPAHEKPAGGGTRTMPAPRLAEALKPPPEPVPVVAPVHPPSPAAAVVRGIAPAREREPIEEVAVEPGLGSGQAPAVARKGGHVALIGAAAAALVVVGVGVALVSSGRRSEPSASAAPATASGPVVQDVVVPSGATRPNKPSVQEEEFAAATEATENPPAAGAAAAVASGSPSPPLATAAGRPVLPLKPEAADSSVHTADSRPATTALPAITQPAIPRPTLAPVATPPPPTTLAPTPPPATAPAGPARSFLAGKSRVDSLRAAKGGGPKGFDLGDAAVKSSAEFEGTLDFEFSPPTPRDGQAFSVKVYLSNTGDKDAKIKNFVLSPTVNGTRQALSPEAAVDEVKKKSRALIYELKGTWKDEKSWELEAVVTTAKQDVCRNRLTWK